MSFEKIPEWGTFGVVLIGGVIGLIEYFDYKAERRVLRSMEFVKELQSEQIVNDLVSLDKAIMSDWPRIRLELIGVDDEKAQEFFTERMASFVVENNVEPAAMRTALLLDSFAVCMGLELCDCETGIAFFGATIAHSWPMIGPFVQDVSGRGRQDGFGASFEKLGLALNKGEEPCPN